jgi:hypothetical protein
MKCKEIVLIYLRSSDLYLWLKFFAFTGLNSVECAGAFRASPRPAEFHLSRLLRGLQVDHRGK